MQSGRPIRQANQAGHQGGFVTCRLQMVRSRRVRASCWCVHGARAARAPAQSKRSLQRVASASAAACPPSAVVDDVVGAVSGAVAWPSDVVAGGRTDAAPTDGAVAGATAAAASSARGSRAAAGGARNGATAAAAPSASGSVGAKGDAIAGAGVK